MASADDPDDLLALAAQPQFGRGKQAIDDQDVLVCTGVDELRLAVRADDEERRHLPLHDAGRELYIDLAPIVVGIDRPPGWPVALDGVAVPALGNLGENWYRRQSAKALASAVGIEPGDRRHVRPLVCPQLDEIGTPVGVDHKVGLDGRPGRLDQDMDPTRLAVAALRIANDPAYRVAGRHRP